MNLKTLRNIFILIFVVFIVGFFIPEKRILPVAGATKSDWNAKSFWAAPWGVSGVHKGIDIFAKKGTPVLASSNMLIIFSGRLSMGSGNAVGKQPHLHFSVMSLIPLPWRMDDSPQGHKKAFYLDPVVYFDMWLFYAKWASILAWPLPQCILFWALVKKSLNDTRSAKPARWALLGNLAAIFRFSKSLYRWNSTPRILTRLCQNTGNIGIKGRF